MAASDYYQEMLISHERPGGAIELEPRPKRGMGEPRSEEGMSPRPEGGMKLEPRPEGEIVLVPRREGRVGSPRPEGEILMGSPEPRDTESSCVMALKPLAMSRILRPSHSRSYYRSTRFLCAAFFMPFAAVPISQEVKIYHYLYRLFIFHLSCTGVTIVQISMKSS